MRIAHLLSATLGAVAMLAAPAFAADDPPANATAPAREYVVRDGKPIKVSSIREIPFTEPNVYGLKDTELWVRKYDNGTWGDWSKVQDFPKSTPIVWTPAEGDWNAYERPVLTSGYAPPVPKGEVSGDQAQFSLEFIIDRTPPAVAITEPKSGFMYRGGDKYAIKWTATDANLRSAPITIEYSRDGSDDHFVVIASALANTSSFDWTVPTDMTKTGRLRLSAMDKAGNIGTTEANNLLVDSIKPKGKVTGPAITNTLKTTLTTSIVDGGPAGLKSAQLWVSTDDGASWTEGPWISDPTKVDWTAPADGTYRLYVLAQDNAGNLSPAASKTVDSATIIVDTTPPLLTLAANIGIIPAGNATPGAQTAFKPGDRVYVAFTVKDVNLAPNSARILIQYAPNGDWSELGRDQPLDATFKFAIPDQASKTVRIKVTAVDLAGNVGEVVSSEPFEIQTGIVVQPTTPNGTTGGTTGGSIAPNL